MDGLKILKIALPEDEALHVLETAVNAGYTYGIGYWANADLITGIGDDKVMALKIEEREEESSETIASRHKLTARSVRRAIEAMLRDPKGTESDGWTQRLLDGEYVDGPLSDAIIQVACFGKIKYA